MFFHKATIFQRIFYICYKLFIRYFLKLQSFIYHNMKQFSDFQSFGPSSAQSHNQQNSIINTFNKSLKLSYTESLFVQDLVTSNHHKNKKQALRKISIHLQNQILKMEQQLNSENKNILKALGSYIQVYCRFKPGQNNFFKYDQFMVDDYTNQYIFDGICSQNATQQEVYNKIAKSHIKEFLQGHNTTIFAYGQTSSGKTHTMLGNLKNDTQQGIIPRALKQIFSSIKNTSEQHHNITCSMLQIYKQKLKDLFSCQKRQLKIKQNIEGTYVQGLMQIEVDNQDQLLNLINFGHSLRKVAQTFHNDYSSRSHTLLILYHRMKKKNKSMIKSKMCLIDLAGSQKVRRTGATGQTLQQAKKINLSLSCLGNVIHCLTSGIEHIPYRDSKLTRILKDSLCGNCKTSIITTCSLNKDDKNETISTMKFAVRAKKIKNRYKYQQKPSESLQQIIKKLQKQLEQTKKQLEKYKLKQSQQLNQQIDVPEQYTNFQPFKSIQYNFNKLIKSPRGKFN